MHSSIRSILFSLIFFLELFSSITIFCSHEDKINKINRRKQERKELQERREKRERQAKEEKKPQKTLEEITAENELKAQQKDLIFARLALPGYGVEVIVDREPVYHLQYLHGSDGTEEVRGMTQSGLIMAKRPGWDSATSCVKLCYGHGPSELPDSVFFLLIPNR